LSNLTQIVSTLAVFLIGGTFSDKVTLWLSKRRGSREPEYQLVNLITPILFGIIGAIVFGYADQFHLHYMVLLLGQFFLLTAPLMAAPIINNYVIESYPQWAGCVYLSSGGVYFHADLCLVVVPC
jgi:MFS family permease